MLCRNDATDREVRRQRDMHAVDPVYGGVIVPLVTPVTAEGDICASSVERLIACVRAGANALIPALTTGEGWRLGPAQWRDMVALTCRFAGGLPVLAGIEVSTTREAIDRARLARKLGATAVVVPPPFVVVDPTADVEAHVTDISLASGLPVLLHNEPTLTRNWLCARTVIDLCRTGVLVGVNDASGSAELTRELVQARTGVPVFQGWENLCEQTTPGVDGYILPLSNLEPALCLAMGQAPSPGLQAEMLRHCAAHDLLGDTWYVGLKRELARRGVIASDRPVSKLPAAQRMDRAASANFARAVM
jgi:4-hydroxy-tetrahydrodipicolinate synthase